MNPHERERHWRRYYINLAVKEAVEDDPKANDWIFRSRGVFDVYCRGAGICPDSVRKVTKKLMAERDGRLEQFVFEG